MSETFIRRQADSLFRLISVSDFVVNQLREDPLHFALLVGRRFGNAKLANSINKLLVKFRSTRPTLTAWYALVDGKPDELSNLVKSMSKLKVSNVELSIVSDICLLAGRPDLSKELLTDRDLDHIWICRSRARLAWFLGEMRPAIELLETKGRKTQRQAQNYRSELDTFSGHNPRVDGDSSVLEPRSGVLHLVTNSLPHTGSGYAQRTHSVLLSLVNRDFKVNAVTRLGYPITIGKLHGSQVDVVDSISYSRMIPRKLVTESVPRIQQQTDLLAAFVRELRPRILHTTTDFTNALSTRSVAEAHGIPWVYEVRGQLVNTWASTRPQSATRSERFKLFELREAELSRSASAVVTLGETMRNDLIRQGVDPNKIIICPNAVGEDYLSEPMSKSVARNTLGLDERFVYVGTVSSLVSYEGLDDLIRAFRIILHENSDVRLLIVGDGADSARLIALAKQLGVFDFCVFPGRVARELARTYHCALDVFVVPRKDLAVTRAVTPLKPVEAMACGVPVVVSDLPALREIVTDQETGLVCESESPGELARAIGRLIESPKLRESLGQRAREKVLLERTWTSNAEKLAQMYDRLSGSGHDPVVAVE